MKYNTQKVCRPIEVFSLLCCKYSLDNTRFQRTASNFREGKVIVLILYYSKCFHTGIAQKWALSWNFHIVRLHSFLFFYIFFHAPQKQVRLSQKLSFYNNLEVGNKLPGVSLFPDTNCVRVQSCTTCDSHRAHFPCWLSRSNHFQETGGWS